MLANLVQESANAPGTAADVLLLGPATGRKAFVAAFGAGATVFYRLSDGTLEEIGIGTLAASPDTLTRGTVLWNSAGTTARLNFTGAVRVVNVLPAERAVYVGMANLLATIGAAARGAIGSSALTMDTARLLGRATAEAGAIEQISIGSKLSLSGGVLDAPLLAPLDSPVFEDLVEVAAGTNGKVRLVAGDGTRPGYIEWIRPDGVRVGYLGWKGSGDELLFVSESGWTLRLPSTVTIAGNAPWHAGNLTPGDYALQSAVPGLAGGRGSLVTLTGTEIDLSGIPAGARRVQLSLRGVSTNGTSPLRLQLGTASAFETSGYTGVVSSLGGGVASQAHPSAGFRLQVNPAAAGAYSGVIELVRHDDDAHAWVLRSQLADPAAATQQHAASGEKALSGALTRLRLTTENGSDTFDAGTARLHWQLT